MQISGKALIAKDGQPLLERQLEPITTRDSVTGPVVEVLMGDNALDPLEFGVCRCFGIRQHKLGVEDVEALVLHRAHVEVAHRDRVELVEVVFEPVNLLIPRHRSLQGGHSMSRERLITRLNMQTQGHLTT